VKREEKQRLVEELHEAWSQAEAGLVAHYRGLSVAEMSELRRALRAAGVSLRVVKNTLARRAVKDTGFSVVTDLLAGPTAVAYGEDAVGMAKVLVDFSKQNKTLEILGGVLEGRLLEKKDVAALANLPSREVLVGMLLNVMQAPLSGFVRTLNEVPATFVRALAAIRDQKQAA
jgi:Ribosomal protein L10